MAYNIYVTDYGEVRVSDREAMALQLAADVRRELRGTPFLSEEAAQRLLGRECACEAVARQKFERA